MGYIQLAHINKSYKLGTKEKVHVLHDVNISFQKGEFVSILGESGSGKSTLMNIIGGMDRNFEGDVLVDGKSLQQMKEKDIDDYRKLNIGFIFQSFNLISHLSVLENVMLTMQMTNRPHTEQLEKAKQILTELGLGQHLYKRPNQLSGGQKQRVAIARALSNDPDIILADEPTGALDKKNSAQIMELLDGIAKKGKLVITVTHSQKVADYGSRIITMDDGKIVKDEKLKEAYTSKERTTHTKTKSLRLLAAMKMAVKNVRLNLKRNLLVSFGGAIGILSVILMLGLGSGVTEYINNEISSSLNPNVIQATKATGKGEEESKQSPLPNPVQTTAPITVTDLEKAKNIKHVKSVDKVFTLTLSSSINFSGKSADIVSFQTMNSGVKESDLREGKLPKKNEILLSDTLAKKLSESPKSLIGKNVTFYVKTKDKEERPIVLEKEATISGLIKGQMNQDTAYTTYDTIANMYKTKKLTLSATQLDVTVDSKNNVDSVQTVLEKKGFTSTGVGSILNQVTTYLRMATALLAGIAGISLLVSAIMIIVVLYISVVERTKEIGILRAVGARKKDIKRIFFAEAAILGTASGLIGVIVASLIGFVGNNVIEKMFDARIIDIGVDYMIFGVVIAVVISIVAALLPAAKAAKLDPMESLRYE
ncbi:macrolide ABC transporter ATP-binding protein/permease [Priestia megaterium]|uniref:ABC transporter ATP-binding protein/permease n=1 Tax=Priestia megaterium TaxID=1404 RepID=UPI000BF4C0DB|nr:ABC transporter ATP-binding protein/permease [Priestia megaterium]PFI60673.1 macrolide ABC transporter ATP-binding protein/permease [Priestia megaterium]PFV93114.1 macrolide ABC transporter ATP-binding protein/permease [Priestia megaterium]